MIRTPAALRRPGRLVGRQMRFELRVFLRDRRATFFTLAFPLMMLILYGAVFGDETVTVEGRDVTWLTFWVPALATLSIVSASFAGLVISIIREREAGVLKRRRATPVPPWTLIGGRALTLLGVSLAGALIVAVVGRVGYDVHLAPSAIPAALVAAVAGSLSLCAVAYAFSTLVGSVDSAMPMTQLVVMPLYFISGIFVPDSVLPDGLVSVGKAFPLEHLASALHTAYQPGGGWAWGDLAVLAAWGLGGVLVAVRRFSWMPSTAPA